MRKPAIIAAILTIAGLWAIALTSMSSGATPPTRIITKTVAIGNTKLHPGTRLTMPTTYHRHHVTHYQWLRCNHAGASCKTIRGATHRTYTVRKADIGHRLRARVTWRGSNTATTNPTPEVGRPLPLNTAAPVISDGGQGGGSITGPIVGDILTGSNGTWTGAVRFSYQWIGCALDTANNTYDLCNPIAGATSTAYTLQSSDVGTELVFQVTAYNFQ
jgi:hypothetical protein